VVEQAHQRHGAVVGGAGDVGKRLDRRPARRQVVEAPRPDQLVVAPHQGAGRQVVEHEVPTEHVVRRHAQLAGDEPGEAVVGDRPAR
jgi:hypothetical protein